LGRYWNIGPQYRLYLPASWLKVGENEVIIYDHFQRSSETLSGKLHLKPEDDLKILVDK